MLVFLTIVVLLLGVIVCVVLFRSVLHSSPAINYFVNRQEFLTMINNGKDPCECDKDSFKCGKYTEGIDVYIKREKE